MFELDAFDDTPKSDNYAYSPDEYEQEKEDGTRQENGAKLLKELKPVHLEMVEMHLQGYKNNDIAEAFDYTASSVSILLRDPLVVAVLDEAKAENRQRLSALMGKAIDVLDEGMDKESRTMDERLKAAGLYFREAAKHGDGGGEESAEDIVQKIINMQINGDVIVQGG